MEQGESDDPVSTDSLQGNVQRQRHATPLAKGTKSASHVHWINNLQVNLDQMLNGPRARGRKRLPRHPRPLFPRPISSALYAGIREPPTWPL